MNQKSHIELINKLLPEMSRTGKPEQVMLKEARKRNMPPAQFEKLAQVFNAMKVNYTLDHQANRGDSFDIVNVPALVSEYMAYNPTVPTKQAATIEYKPADKLPSIFDVLEHEGNQNNKLVIENLNDYSEQPLVGSPDAFDVTFDKKAATGEKELSDFDKQQLLKKAAILRTQILAGIDDDLKKCASRVHHVIADAYNPEKKQEVAEDAFIAFGKEASAEIYSYLKDYCKSQHYVTPEMPDFSKKASVRTLARDRYNVLGDMQQIHELLQLRKQAASDLDDSDKEKTFDFGSNAKNFITAINPLKSTGAVVKHLDTASTGIMGILNKMLPVNTEKQQKIDKAEEDAKYNVAASEMLMDNAIIAKADPTKVQQLIDDVRGIAPTMAKYPKMLAPLIAQAIQYDYNFPPQLVLNMATIEEKLSNTKSKEEARLKDKYNK